MLILCHKVTFGDEGDAINSGRCILRPKWDSDFPAIEIANLDEPSFTLLEPLLDEFGVHQDDEETDFSSLGLQLDFSSLKGNLVDVFEQAGIQDATILQVEDQGMASPYLPRDQTSKRSDRKLLK
ncbi:hypothetical protein HDU96_004290 [Phlyctochytrium bullatum]|nr:hypothetical protein HDU96_004290 [Phlyctochytrium bullatum]